MLQFFKIKQLTLIAGIAGTMAAFSPLVAFAETVTLVGKDGNTSVVGDLISFENGVYLIKTGLGQIEISATLADCEGPGCPVARQADTVVDVRISGSGAVAKNLMPFLLIGYAGEYAGSANTGTSENPDETVYHLTSGDTLRNGLGSFATIASNSDMAFDDLFENRTHMALSARRILPSEARSFREDGAGNMVSDDQEHVIATENVVVIVNRANPISQINMEDLQRIFSGEITNWSTLGGENAAIELYMPSQSLALRSFFDERVLTNSSSGPGFQHNDEDGISSAVSRDANGIGYVGAASRGRTDAIEIIGTCGITFSLDPFTTKSEDYPLSRRIYAYNRGDADSADLPGFIDYISSASADLVIGSSAYESLSVIRIPQDRAELRLRTKLQTAMDTFEFNATRSMLESLDGRDRLSSTIRFVPNSDRLDAKAHLDIDRLIEYLVDEPIGTRVTSVGFTDSEGPMPGNIEISLKRSTEVLALVQQRAAGRLDHIQFNAEGFGEILPVACNDTRYGRTTNGRVEFWIRN